MLCEYVCNGTKSIENAMQFDSNVHVQRTLTANNSTEEEKNIGFEINNFFLKLEWNSIEYIIIW